MAVVIDAESWEVTDNPPKAQDPTKLRNIILAFILNTSRRVKRAVMRGFNRAMNAINRFGYSHPLVYQMMVYFFLFLGIFGVYIAAVLLVTIVQAYFGIGAALLALAAFWAAVFSIISIL